MSVVLVIAVSANGTARLELCIDGMAVKVGKGFC